MTKRQIFSIFFTIIGLLCLALAFGALMSANAYHLLRTGKYEKSYQSAQFALPIARFVSTTWSSSLQSLSAIDTTLLALQKLQAAVGAGKTPNITELVHNLRQLAVNLQSTTETITNSPLLSRLFNQQLAQLQTVNQTLAQALPLGEYFSEGDKTLLILLQNSDELRATGGFMGSYVLLHFDFGKLKEIVVEDIYDADGQINQYFEPPSGVREYLSGGKGWRLPDANWHPDFVKSSENILQFFALAKRNHIDGVIAINLPLIQSLLAVTGPITLPDQSIVLSETNVAQVLRSNRQTFFAGSIEKKHILLQAITQLKLAVAKLNREEKSQIIIQLKKQISQNNLQLYLPNPDLETNAQNLGLAEILGPKNLASSTLFYYPLESNVGINKVNASVSREFVITNTNTLTELGIILHNSSSQDGYVNYQRLIFNTGQQIEQVIVNGKQITNFDSELVASSSGIKYKQIGFLVTTLANSTSQIAITLKHPVGFKSIMLQKQPGTRDTTLTNITSQGVRKLEFYQSFLEYMIE